MMSLDNTFQPLILGDKTIRTPEAKVFAPEEFQKGFIQSTCPFPGFFAAWGTGKTLSMIMKGMILSLLYPGNRGLLLRKTFKSLSRSTMVDFTKWTGLKIPGQKQEVEIPHSGGSAVVFAHAENLEDFRDTIQGMNLGWAGIEQADELETADVFEMLEGRVRRILTPCLAIQRRLVELGYLKKPVKDFETLHEDKRNDIEDAIINELHLPVRQLMAIANTNGHNWFWKRWKKQKWPGHEMWEAKSYQNKKHLPRSTLLFWESLKHTAPKKYNRYVQNSWEDYDIEGAFYAALMSDALKANRVERQGLYETDIPVYTFFDLGIRASDTTAIWFVQFIGEEIWLVDYYEAYGHGMEHYSKVMDRKPYTYAAMYLPPDASQGMQVETVKTRLNIMRKLRREPVRLVMRHHVEERIATVRGLLHRCKFSVNCERGVDALNNYKKKKLDSVSTEETPVFMSIPKHDEWSNGADSFGYMCIVKRYQPPRQDETYNMYSDETEWLEEELDSDVAGTTDLLKI